MTLWALASRRIIPGTVQRSSSATTVAAAIGGTRQMSVADKDNILPVSIDDILLERNWADCRLFLIIILKDRILFIK